MSIEIHDTAFVTSSFRASNETLSHDAYAKLWRTKKASKWAKTYLEQVSTHEDTAHCLRNRYFLDNIKNLIKYNNIEVLINFGCGFSMYPFLLDNTLINIEIDKPEIIEHKKHKIKEWQEQDKLPERNIHFLGVDFNGNYTEDLITKINDIKDNKSSFILIEGVLFFLNLKETNILFRLFSNIQKQGDVIGSASFQDSIKETTSFKKLLKFMDSKTTITNYLTVNDTFYNNISRYDLIDIQDYYSLSKKYLNITNINKNDILNERFYLLKHQ